MTLLRKTMTRLLLKSLPVLLLTVFCTPAAAQVGKLYPVDEAAKDPSFFTFRASLLRAIQKRDTVFLLNIVDPNIQNSFGGDGGIAEFKKMWRPERADSEVWTELLTALALGGRFENPQTFMAPYVFSNFPEQFDVFEHGAIIGEGVRVRKAANTNSQILATLSFDILKVTAWPTNEKSGWVAVELANGEKGYVAPEFIRSPVAYRAIFQKQNGKWIMTAFVAGD